MSKKIALTVEDDGQVMIAASEVISWMRECAEWYGTGKAGGPRLMQKGACDALTETADSLESACIGVAADALTRVWWRS
jgi:hypothetical protein